MEGVLFVIKSWALVGSLLWLYRRYLERVAPADLEFEVWCSTSPLIAALHGEALDLERVEAAIRRRLGPRSRAVATLGGWPWPNYSLQLRLTRDGDVLGLSIVRAELLRTHGAPPPSLVLALRDALGESTSRDVDSWLLAGTVYGRLGPDEAPHGWQLLPGGEGRPRPRAHENEPAWLERARGVRVSAADPCETSAKLHDLRAEC